MQEPLNRRRFQFRTVDLLLATVVVALTVAAAKEGPIYGTAHSPVLFVLLAGILGAVTGRVASGAVRIGIYGGILLGVLGYVLAVLALSLGIKIADGILFFVCVSAGGVIGGLIPTMLRQWRQVSLRGRMTILLAGFGCLVILAIRWCSVSEQNRLVAELHATGATVSYADENPFPLIFDSRRMQSHSEWLRQLLGLRVLRGITFGVNFDPANSWTTNPLIPLIGDLGLNADYVNEEAFELLNSGKLSRLDSLRIGGRDFDDTSLSRLDPLANLVHLDLEFTSVTDASIEHICSFPQLKYLNVRQTLMTPAGVKRLKSKFGARLASN